VLLCLLKRRHFWIHFWTVFWHLWQLFSCLCLGSPWLGGPPAACNWPSNHSCSSAKKLNIRTPNTKFFAPIGALWGGSTAAAGTLPCQLPPPKNRASIFCTSVTAVSLLGPQGHRHHNNCSWHKKCLNSFSFPFFPFPSLFLNVSLILFLADAEGPPESGREGGQRSEAKC
jgi:hypothetical protein